VRRALGRLALGAFVGAVAAAGAVIIVNLLQVGPVWPAIGRFVVRGHLTAANGRPAGGVKVWLNAVPGSTAGRAGQRAREPARGMVVGSSVSSVSGAYAIPVVAPGKLARSGVVQFQVMAGNRQGWGVGGFAGRLLQTATGPMLVRPDEGAPIIDLRLTRRYPAAPAP